MFRDLSSGEPVRDHVLVSARNASVLLKTTDAAPLKSTDTAPLSSRFPAQALAAVAALKALDGVGRVDKIDNWTINGTGCSNIARKTDDSASPFGAICADVTRFGAIPDDDIDDTAAIQTATAVWLVLSH